jgi:chorismate mutase
MVSLSHSRALVLVLPVLLAAACEVRRSEPQQPRPAAPAEPEQEAPEAPQPVRRLLLLMKDRLALMHDVARTKWNARRPVADPDREQALLRDMEERGRTHDLDPAQTRAFFTAQMEAARRIQEADTRRWQSEERGPFPDAPDLASLRRRIDRLNQDLLAALADSRPFLREEAGRRALARWAQQAIVGEGISDDIREVAVRPLMKEEPPR